MDKNFVPNVISAERVGDAVLIEFNNRKCALYSAALLYEILSRATAFKNTEPDGVEE